MENNLVVGTKGTFEFNELFSKFTTPRELLTVTAIRSLEEMDDSDPLTNIYLSVGLTEDDYKRDKKNKIPTITLTNSGGEHLYVPLSAISEAPNLTGVEYQSRLLAIPLGVLPVGFDLTTMLSDIEGLVADRIGRETTASEVKDSSIIMMDKDESELLEKVTLNRHNVYKSFETRYREMTLLCDKKDELIRVLSADIVL